MKSTAVLKAMSSAKVAQRATTPANSALIEKTLVAIQSTMLELYDRWQDEKKYEDINDYAKALHKSMPKQFTFERMTKAPFAYHFRIGDQTGYHFYVNTKAVGWSRKYRA